ncbi:MAG: hypothetical protein GY757_03955, partial [bacterium]|nr:hypothetical protein [bacterium]
MKIIALFLIFLTCSSVLYSAERVASFPELMTPKYMIVDDGKIIISDYPYIYLYSLTDYSLIKKIGGVGEGPGNFYIMDKNRNLKDRGLVINVCPDFISAGSIGRVSHFNKNGEFLKFVKVPYGINSKFFSLCDKWLGFIPRGIKGELRVYILDSKMNVQKKIMECDYWFNLDPKIKTNFFDRACDTLLTAIQDNKIFITRGDSKSLAIDVFDFSGSKRHTIKHPVEKTRVPQQFIERIREHYRAKFRLKDIGEFMKTVNIPAYFPPVRHLCASNHKLYVITFRMDSGKSECLVFSTGGEFLKKIRLPVKEQSPEYLFPFSISKSTFYQLVEDKDEKWELIVTPIK